MLSFPAIHAIHRAPQHAVSQAPRFQAAAPDSTAAPPLDKQTFINAVYRDNFELVEKCLNHGIDVNTGTLYEETALILAAKYKKPEICQLLITRKAQVNKIDLDKRTALIWAADQGDLEIVEALLAGHAKLNKQDISKKTALIWAAMNQHVKVVNALLRAGAAVNIKDKDGITALHWAVKKGNLAIVQALLNHKADITITDNDGMTALQWAARNGQLEIVKAFINHKARNKASRHETATDRSVAFRLALMYGRNEIAQYLLEQPNILLPLGLQAKDLKAILGLEPLSASVEKTFIAQLLNLAYTKDISEVNDPLGPLLSYLETRANHTAYTALNPSAFEAELLFLLRHHQIGLSLAQPLRLQIYKTLSSQYASVRTHHLLHETNRDINSLIQVWGEFGFHTQDFITQKYDTRCGKESLLCQQEVSGSKFEFIPKNENWPFGDQFILEAMQKEKNIPLGRRVLYCHGFKAVSDNQVGTLIIRNSSPIFGRDRLKHVAYFSPQPLNKEELLALHPDRDHRFKSALDPKWYQSEGLENNLGAMAYLSRTLLDVRNELFAERNLYHFTDDDKPVWTPPIGFKQMLDVLTHFMMTEKPLPSLALINPHYPAHQPMLTLPMTEERIQRMTEAMGHNQHQRWSEDFELWQFIQTGIFQHNLALTFVDPPQPDPAPPDTNPFTQTDPLF